MAAGQLRGLPALLKAKARNAERFLRGVAPLGVSIQASHELAERVFYRLVGMWPALGESGVPTDTLLSALQAEGVQARRLPFGAIHHAPLFRIPDVLDRAAAGNLAWSQCLPTSHLPITDQLVEGAFELLPLGHEEDVNFVDLAIEAYHKIWHHRKVLASIPVPCNGS
jgi:dTDP-4-amino-4,6-dideoxygalactose transaminase